MLNEGNQIHNLISSSGSGTVINYGSGYGSDFLTSYGSGSGSTTLKIRQINYARFKESAVQICQIHQLPMHGGVP
jgi:hypothetical protein